MARGLDVVRRISDDWSRGDFRDTASVYDPHALLVLRPEFPDSGVYHGPEEIARYTRDLLASWTDFAIEAGDSVVVAVHQRASAGRVGSWRS